MAQHFLLSSAARTLSLASVARMSEEEAHAKFTEIRWPDGPHCPRCGGVTLYTYKARKLWKCKACQHQFSVTSGTIFASRKMSVRDYLMAIAIVVNGAKGISALQLARDLDVQYRTAFVLAHKLREAMASEIAGETLGGTVEVDGAYFGGHIRPADAIDLIYTYSGGYPYFIQFMCREAYDAYLQKRADGIKPTVPVGEIVRKLDNDFFAGRWARVTDRQQQLLYVIAHLETANEEFTVQEIHETSNLILSKPFGRSHINQMLASLITSGLVYKDRHGKYLFAVPLMSDFIKRAMPIEISVQ
jgi:transposase-like protein